MQWRSEAAAVTTDDMRAFCLDEAARCEGRLRRSFLTPFFKGRDDHTASC